jgi:hypothetical protein
VIVEPPVGDLHLVAPLGDGDRVQGLRQVDCQLLGGIQHRGRTVLMASQVVTPRSAADPPARLAPR